MSKKKHGKRKKSKRKSTLALFGAMLSQALGQVLGDAIELAAEHVSDLQDKARKAMKKKRRPELEDGSPVTS